MWIYHNPFTVNLLEYHSYPIITVVLGVSFRSGHHWPRGRRPSSRELNSAHESFCNAQKTPAQLLAWALAPLAATEPRQEADSLTTRRRRKRRRSERRRRCGKGLGSETQGSPSPGSLVSTSVVHGGRGQCLLLSGTTHMQFPPRYCP